VRARRVRPPQQALHGWLLAICSAGLAVAAHGVAGGGLPDAALTLPLTALIGWGATAFAHRLRGWVATTVVLGLLQYTLHLLLTESATNHAGHHHATGFVVSGWTMVAGHALATVLTAVLLSRASAAVTIASSALARLRSALSALLAVPVPAPDTIGVPSAVPARPGSLLEIQFRRVRARRGPPARS
jgi:hypothetical protein